MRLIQLNTGRLAAGLALVVCAAAASVASAATVLTGPITYNGHSYYLLSQDTWTNSEAAAVDLGGHLVTVNDAAENDWVFEEFASYGGVDRNLWIGLNDVAEEGMFVWSSGEAVTYTNWAPGQPNDDSVDPEQDYVHIFKPNTSAANAIPTTWNDVQNSGGSGVGDSTIPFGVVEVASVVPAPGAAAGGLAMMGLAILRRRR